MALSGEGVQPGGRAAAPGELAVVQQFLNTHYDLDSGLGGELLTTPERLSQWLADHGVLEPRTSLSASQLQRALAIREGLRELAHLNGGDQAGQEPPASLNRALETAVVEISLRRDGPRFRAVGRDDFEQAIAQLVAIVARAMFLGSWERLKACPGEHCGWAFYDHSRNRSGRWCSMSICGARAKAKAHYHRRRGR